MDREAETATARASPGSGVVRRLAPGDVLVREGDDGGDVFEIESGWLEVLRGPELTRVGTVGPGALVGEISALAGTPRTATVRALESATVRDIPRERYQRWLEADEARLAQVTELARARIDRNRAGELVAALLATSPSVAAEVVELATWIHLEAGDVLFAEGDPSDAGYLVVSGRLGVVQGDSHVGEVGRGEVVGEMGLIERTPRSATVTALRETSLARFAIEAFLALTARHPTLMLQLSRTIVARLARPYDRADRARSIVIAVTADVDRRVLATRLAAELSRFGRARHLWAARVDAELGRDGLCDSPRKVVLPAVSEYLQEVETSHDYLLLEAEEGAVHWTRRALTLADRIVVVVSGRPDAEEVARAEALLAAAPPRSQVERWLVLLHTADVERPSGTAPLVERLGVDRVAHVREGSAADVARVARLVSGNGTGLVLGGGGARGFAHLGVWRALAELGIEVDAIAGASMGAALGAGMALQTAADELTALAAELFHDLLDYTVPVVSLIKGERITRNLTHALGDLDIRDLWLPFACVSTNLTRSALQVHDSGGLATAVRASVAIPGILPPVPMDGDLLVDGGVLNNLPADVLRATRTVGTVIAVDLSPASGPRASEDFGLSVSGWKALRSRREGGGRFPGLMSVLMRAMVAGSVRDRDRMVADGTVDCYLDLDLRGVALLDFERVRETADRGYDVARPRLEAWLGSR
jgi:predicted acylesterase/phospholipase RssA/CRP-like cAMP-binding protein